MNLGLGHPAVRQPPPLLPSPGKLDRIPFKSRGSNAVENAVAIADHLGY